MSRVHPFWNAPPVVSDEEHLALALEFMDPEVGREYLREQGQEDLLGEFERLSEEQNA